MDKTDYYNWLRNINSKDKLTAENQATLKLHEIYKCNKSSMNTLTKANRITIVTRSERALGV